MKSEYWYEKSDWMKKQLIVEGNKLLVVVVVYSLFGRSAVKP